MALFFVIAFVFYALIALFLFNNFYLKRRRLPPGPIPLPLIGNLISIVLRPPGEDCYISWRRKYGPVYTFWSGDQPMVMVADYKTLIDTFQRDSETYAGRFVFDEMEKLVKGKILGVVFTEDDLWRDQRRFCIRVFRDFGLGKNLMQEKILAEIGARFSELDEQISLGVKIHDMGAMFDIAIGSIINSILLGYRFDKHRSAQFYQLKTLITNFVHGISNPIYLIMSPNPHTYKHLPLFSGALAKTRKNYQTLLDFFKHQIEEHIQEINLDNMDEPATDFVEAFLREKYKRDYTNTNDYYTLDQLAHMCFDVWGAGQETTSVTLAWTVACVLNNPDVQRRMQNEMDAVVGSTERFITMNDRPMMPYTCAVVNETQRIANLLPLNLPHRTTRDTEINGHFLPKGTCVIPQISVILYDETIFPKPREFIPERFLTDEGRLKKSEELIPFSIGKRQCLGESLARQELFLFVANFFNHYKVSATAEPPSLARSLGFIAYCPNFKCRVQRRVAHKKSVTNML